MDGEKRGAGQAIAVPFRSWWMAGVLFGLYVFSWLDRLILSMLVEPIKADLGLSDFQVGELLGPAFAISYALFGLPLGWAVDRFSRRWIVLFSVLFWALATIASALSHSFTQLLLARVCVGVGEAALLPAAYSMLADEFPRQRLTTATATFQMGGKVGSATAFGLGGVVIALAGALGGWRMPLLGPLEPWQIVMTLVGAPGLALAFLALTLREPPRKQNVILVGDVQGKTRAVMNRFLAANWRLAVLMVASFSCLAICGYSLTAWAPTYIERAFGWTPQQYGPGLSVMNLIAAASLVMNGKIVDHLFSRGMRDAHLRFYSWLMVLIAPVVVLLFMAPNAYVFLGLYCIVQFVTVPYMVYLSSVVALLAPNAVRGQLLAGFLFISTLLGLGAGPAMVGALTDFVFHDESRIGDSLMIVVVGCFALSLATMRWALVYLGPSVTRAEGGLRGGVVT